MAPAADEVVLSLGDAILRRSDVELLSEPNWLNDNVIGFYFEFLHIHKFKSSDQICFLSPEVSQFVKMSNDEDIAVFLSPLQLHDKTAIFLAVNNSWQQDMNDGSHWSLLVYSGRLKKFFHLDSLGSVNRANADFMAKKLYHFLCKSGDGAGAELVMRVAPVQRQTNGYDCGIHVLCNAEHWAQHLLLETVPSEPGPIDTSVIKNMRARLRQLVIQLSCEMHPLTDNSLHSHGPTRTHQMLGPSVVMAARGRHTATLIFLHGLGDTGHGWAAALNTIKPTFLKLICPTAPTIPVTLNGGMRMPAWYDILSMSHDELDIREDLNGVEQSTQTLEALIDKETNDNIPRKRIMIGGFSQGGAVALCAALRAKKPLAGCVALSSYLPGNKVNNADKIREEGKMETPILQCHGEMDLMVPFARGKDNAETLAQLVQDHQFFGFPHLGHDADEDTLSLVRDFINQKLSHDC